MGVADGVSVSCSAMLTGGRLGISGSHVRPGLMILILQRICTERASLLSVSIADLTENACLYYYFFLEGGWLLAYALKVMLLVSVCVLCVCMCMCVWCVCVWCVYMCVLCVVCVCMFVCCVCVCVCVWCVYMCGVCVCVCVQNVLTRFCTE